MNELLLVVTIAGERVALPAAAVESVVELDALIQVPRAAPHVAGLSALRSRVLTVIDGLASLEFGRAPVEGLLEAIIVPSGGHTYALLVDSVEDVIVAQRPPAPIRTPVGAGWDRVAIGTIDADKDLLLLVDPHLMIAGPTAQAA